MQPKLYSINLSIADFTIRLVSEYNLELEDGYLPFSVENPTEEAEIELNCSKGLPIFNFENEQPAFEAKNETQKFYSIYKRDDKLIFLIYNQQFINEVQQIAILDSGFTHWEIYSNESEGRLLPLKYPLGPIILHYLTIKTNAVMMHASCAFDGKKGRIFTGFSGAGKSTMSKIMADAGNQIINDDRVIIRKIKNQYWVYNTPMYYRDSPKKAPLDFIYLISHSPENRIKKLTGALAVSKVMAFCIQNNFDNLFIDSRLNFFTELCSTVGICELGFVPDSKVVPFIHVHE
jgi:hypothetical protein